METPRLGVHPNLQINHVSSGGAFGLSKHAPANSVREMTFISPVLAQPDADGTRAQPTTVSGTIIYRSKLLAGLWQPLHLQV